MTLRDLFRNSLLTIRNLLRSLRRGSLGFRMGGPHMGVLRLGELAIALKVKVKALE